MVEWRVFGVPGEREPVKSQESSRQLPSPRQVSSVLFPDADIKDPQWTLLAMQYGQIITHDMSMAAGTTQASECHNRNKSFPIVPSICSPFHLRVYIDQLKVFK